MNMIAVLITMLFPSISYFLSEDNPVIFPFTFTRVYKLNSFNTDLIPENNISVDLSIPSATFETELSLFIKISSWFCS